MCIYIPSVTSVLHLCAVGGKYCKIPDVSYMPYGIDIIVIIISDIVIGSR